MIRLETERLLFRDHIPADLEPYCEMESDPEYRWPQRVHPREEIVRSFDTWLEPKPMKLLATIFKPDGQYIGRCGLYPLRNEQGEIVPGEANIAFYIARPYWRRGLATEAGAAFVKHGFEHLALDRIEAGINDLNVASIRVVEKLGFKPVRSGEGGGSRWHVYELLR